MSKDQVWEKTKLSFILYEIPEEPCVARVSEGIFQGYGQQWINFPGVWPAVDYTVAETNRSWTERNAAKTEDVPLKSRRRPIQKPKMSDSKTEDVRFKNRRRPIKKPKTSDSKTENVRFKNRRRPIQKPKTSDSTQASSEITQRRKRNDVTEEIKMYTGKKCATPQKTFKAVSKVTNLRWLTPQRQRPSHRREGVDLQTVP